jgi:hypothetical protein
LKKKKKRRKKKKKHVRNIFILSDPPDYDHFLLHPLQFIALSIRPYEAMHNTKQVLKGGVLE